MYVFLTFVPLSLSLIYSSLFSLVPHTFTCTVLPFTISPFLFTESSVHCNDLRSSQSPFAKVLQSQTYLLFFCLLVTRQISNPQQTITIQQARLQGLTWMLLWISGTLPNKEKCVHVVGSFHGYCFIVGPFFLDTTTTMCGYLEYQF